MRSLSSKLTVLMVLGFMAQSAAFAQTPEELERIRQMRLLEWHSQQESPQYYEQDGQVIYDTQNVSFDQPYQNQAVAAPDREDLFNAASAGNIQQIRKLLSEGLDVNVSNSERETALHMASARGHFDAVLILVNNGANVNARTVKNWIPLHHAVRFRHPNIVNFLYQRGSSAGARTSDGLSPIDIAKNNNDYRLLSILGAR